MALGLLNIREAAVFAHLGGVVRLVKLKVLHRVAQDPRASVADRLVAIYLDRRYGVDESLSIASGPALGVLQIVR